MLFSLFFGTEGLDTFLQSTSSELGKAQFQNGNWQCAALLLNYREQGNHFPIYLSFLMLNMGLYEGNVSETWKVLAVASQKEE